MTQEEAKRISLDNADKLCGGLFEEIRKASEQGFLFLPPLFFGSKDATDSTDLRKQRMLEALGYNVFECGQWRGPSKYVISWNRD